MAARKTIEIVVTGSFEMPFVTDPEKLEGKSVEIDLTGATVTGLVTQVGNIEHTVKTGRRRGRRPVEGKVSLNIAAQSIVVREVAPSPGGGSSEIDPPPPAPDPDPSPPPDPDPDPDPAQPDPG